MKKTLEFNEALTKINAVFPTDVYIIYNRFIIAGEKSGVAGWYLAIATEAVTEGLQKKFKNDQIVYIKNLRNAKDHFKENHSIIEDGDKKNEILKRQQMLFHNFKKVETWKMLTLTEEQKTALFVTNTTIHLFEEDENIPTLIIGKKLLPLVTEKNYEKVGYFVEDIDNSYGTVHGITFDVPGEFLQLILNYLYV